MLRLPDGMRETIKKEAEASGRSMNAEIVHRLSQSLHDDPDLVSFRLSGIIRSVLEDSVPEHEDVDAAIALRAREALATSLSMEELDKFIDKNPTHIEELETLINSRNELKQSNRNVLRQLQDHLKEVDHIFESLPYEMQQRAIEYITDLKRIQHQQAKIDRLENQLNAFKSGQIDLLSDN